MRCPSRNNARVRRRCSFERDPLGVSEMRSIKWSERGCRARAAPSDVRSWSTRSKVSTAREQPHSNRERDLEQRLGLAEPVRPHSTVREIPVRTGPKDRYRELRSHRSRSPSSARMRSVERPTPYRPACRSAVGYRCSLDNAAQLNRFSRSEFKWQVADRSFRRFSVRQKEIIPGLKMGTDFTRARAMKIADDS